MYTNERKLVKKSDLISVDEETSLRHLILLNNVARLSQQVNKLQSELQGNTRLLSDLLDNLERRLGLFHA